MIKSLLTRIIFTPCPLVSKMVLASVKITSEYFLSCGRFFDEIQCQEVITNLVTGHCCV